TPKAIDLLVALVEARGEPVTKEELLQKVWAGTVVEEGSLTTHVSVLRKALGEGYIETLSKRGYRFVGKIVDAPSPAPPSSRTVTFLFTSVESATPSCVAFPDAGAAVLAAIEAQRAHYPPGVRIGLHSGTVEDPDGEGISGPTRGRG